MTEWKATTSLSYFEMWHFTAGRFRYSFFFYFKNNVRLPFSYIKYNLWLYIIYHLTGKCFSLLKTVADNSVRENKNREICICNNNIKRKILFCLCPSFYSPASWSFTVACCTILLIAWSKPIIKIIRLCLRGIAWPVAVVGNLTTLQTRHEDCNQQSIMT